MWIPNGANEAVVPKLSLQWIPNGANEAVLLKLRIQWIRNGANEAVLRCKPSPQNKRFSIKESVSTFFTIRMFMGYLKYCHKWTIVYVIYINVYNNIISGIIG